MKIGMLGLGTVGGGVAQILESPCGRSPFLPEIKLSRVAVRDLAKSRNVGLPQGILTTQPEEVIDDPEIALVVEVMGGIEPARTLVLKAIERGKHIVTANKSLIAAHGSEIFALAKDKGVCIAFEAAVGGGIPIIQCLKQSLGANRLRAITGIVNGTTNYILAQMSREGVDFEPALKEAIEKGFAEANSSADIDGIDAAEKLAILTLISWNLKVDCPRIFTRGIRSIKQQDIEYAKRLNYTIKLLATARIEEENSLCLHVQPHLVANSHPLASVNDAFNAIFLEGEPVGSLMLYGKGAGAGATASAVVSDILNIVANSSAFPILPTTSLQSATCSQEAHSHFYLRLLTDNSPTAVGGITWSLGMFNVVPLSVQQNLTQEGLLEIVIVTQSVFRSTLDNAIRSIVGLPYFKEVANILPILEA